MSNRVKFVGENGETFFECHPAEARLAKETIEHQRAKDLIPLEMDILSSCSKDELLDIKLTIEKEKKELGELKEDVGFLTKIFSKTPNFQGKWTGGLLNCLVDLYKCVENKDLKVTHLLMNSKTYSNLRCYHRDILEVETRREYLKVGVMAVLWGAKIFISQTMDNDVIIASSNDFKKDENVDNFPVFSFKYISPNCNDGFKDMDVLKEIKNFKDNIGKIQSYIERKQILKD